MTDSESDATRTRLQRFLNMNRIPAARLETATGISRQGLRKIRRGRGDLRLSTALRILVGVRKITGRRVMLDEIFTLDPDAIE